MSAVMLANANAGLESREPSSPDTHFHHVFAVIVIRVTILHEFQKLHVMIFQ